MMMQNSALSVSLKYTGNFVSAHGLCLGWGETPRHEGQLPSMSMPSKAGLRHVPRQWEDAAAQIQVLTMHILQTEPRAQLSDAISIEPKLCIHVLCHSGPDTDHAIQPTARLRG